LFVAYHVLESGSNLEAGGKVEIYEASVACMHVVNEAGEATGQPWSAI
jgi:hypothetical protein